MPFTVSHAAAVLPIHRWSRNWLPMTALMVVSMSPYFGFADHLRRIAEKLGLAGVPFYYNMGQTLVVARKIA